MRWHSIRNIIGFNKLNPIDLPDSEADAEDDGKPVPYCDWLLVEEGFRRLEALHSMEGLWEIVLPFYCGRDHPSWQLQGGL